VIEIRSTRLLASDDRRGQRDTKLIVERRKDGYNATVTLQTSRYIRSRREWIHTKRVLGKLDLSPLRALATELLEVAS
jgi:hypothetical protein